jgi:hypothetical protein
MKLPAILPDHFLKALPEEERKKLGRVGMTFQEAQVAYIAGQEKRLQGEIAAWLDYEGIYFESDRTDRKTSGRKGRADFRLCVHGRWLSIEAKTSAGHLTPEQKTEAARLERSGGKFIVCRSLKEVIEAVRNLSRQQKPKP